MQTIQTEGPFTEGLFINPILVVLALGLAASAVFVIKRLRRPGGRRAFAFIVLSVAGLLFLGMGMLLLSYRAVSQTTVSYQQAITRNEALRAQQEGRVPKDVYPGVIYQEPYRAAMSEDRAANGQANVRPDSQPPAMSAIPPSPVPPSPSHYHQSPVMVNRELLQFPPASATVPDWVSKPVTSAGHGGSVILSSGRFATLEQAMDEDTTLALKSVRDHFHAEFPNYGYWEIPISTIQRDAVKQSACEVMDKDFGGFKAKMYRAHVQLALTPELRASLYAIWRSHVVDTRLIILGSLFGLATLVLATIAAVFRLDERSLGAFRGRLKLAACTFIGAGILVAGFVVMKAVQESQPTTRHATVTEHGWPN